MALYQEYAEALRGKTYSHDAIEGITWTSPSNIAMVKYWGKHGDQYPLNPSISMTLSEAHTRMSLAFTKRSEPGMQASIDFTFEGKPNPDFAARIADFLTRHVELFPYIKKHHLRLTSANSFPHSTGIASSASAFSALALCLVTLEDQIYGGHLSDDDDFRQKASFIARLASGSASRSIYEEWAWWGHDPHLSTSSDDYAVGIAEAVHPVFKGMKDSIVIVSSAKKEVSSSLGHKLMHQHPYRSDRLTQARRHVSDLHSALRSGDMETFMRIVETEALALHALMLSSYPGYRLMTPASWEVIDEIRVYRAETNHPICFTLDAGPNVHVLYPADMAQKVRAFIDERLVPLSESILHDQMGQGPVQI